MDEQRQRLSIKAGELGGKPIKLLGFTSKPGVHDQRIQPDETPPGSVETPAIFAENRNKSLPVCLRRQLWERRADQSGIVANVVIAGKTAAVDRKRIMLRLGKSEIVRMFRAVKAEIATVDDEIGSRGVDVFAYPTKIFDKCRLVPAEM
jgi:hypothetical protein